MERLRDGMWLLESQTPSNPNTIVIWRGVDFLITDPGIARFSRVKNQELETLRRNFSRDVGGIVLLHSHPDHIGNIPGMADASVPIYLHPKGFWSLRSPGKLLHAERVLSGRRGARAFFPLWKAALFPAYGRIKFGPGMAGTDKSTEGGRYRALPQRFVCHGYSLEVLPMPGHTPGEVNLWEPEQRILIHGDLIPNTHVGRDHIPSLYLPEANIYAALTSLEIIRSMRPRLLVPAHGEPLRSEKAIHERCTRMIGLLDWLIREVLFLHRAHPLWTVERIAKHVFDHPVFPQTKRFSRIERCTMVLSVLRDRR